MEDIVFPPTQQILRTADLLSSAVGRFLRARHTLPEIGRYEYEIESLNMMYLLLRNVEGCIQLARTDLVLLPAAMTLARSAYEIAFKIMWMLDPEYLFDREARWLAHLKTEVDYFDKLIARYKWIDQNAGDLNATRQQLESFRTGVEALLPDDVARVVKMPDLFSMMRSMNDERRYLGYIVLSQFAHGTHTATGLYRKHLGTKKELDEFIEASNWSVPLGSCWYALYRAGSKLLKQIGGDPDSFVDDEFESLVQLAVDAIKQ